LRDDSASPSGSRTVGTPVICTGISRSRASRWLYYDGIVYSGITGGEFGIRGRLTALDAKTGKILWRAYTLPAAGEPGGDTWPAGTDHYSRGGASIWNTPALGLVYFAVGNCGPDYRCARR
jgi:quinohemoprotein ethanol dehydrogenase